MDLLAEREGRFRLHGVPGRQSLEDLITGEIAVLPPAEAAWTPHYSGDKGFLAAPPNLREWCAGRFEKEVYGDLDNLGAAVMVFSDGSEKLIGDFLSGYSSFEVPYKIPGTDHLTALTAHVMDFRSQARRCSGV